MADLLCTRRGHVPSGSSGGVKLPPVASFRTPTRNGKPERFFVGRPQNAQGLPRLQKKNAAMDSTFGTTTSLRPVPVSFGSSAYYTPPPQAITYKIAQTGAAVLPGGRPDLTPIDASTPSAAALTPHLTPVYPFCVVPGRSQLRATQKHPSAKWQERESFFQKPGLAIDESETYVRDELAQFDQRLHTLEPLGAGRSSAFPAMTPAPRVADVLFLVMLLRNSKMIQTLHAKGPHEIAHKWASHNLAPLQKIPKANLHRVLRSVCKTNFCDTTADRLYSLFGSPSAPHQGMNLQDVQLGVDLIMSASDPTEALQFYFSLTGGLENSSNMCDYITRFEIDVLNRAYANTLEDGPPPFDCLPLLSRTTSAPHPQDAEAVAEPPARREVEKPGTGSTATPPQTSSTAGRPAQDADTDPMSLSVHLPAYGIDDTATPSKPKTRVSLDKKPAFVVPEPESNAPSKEELVAIANSLEYDSFGRVPLKSFTAAFTNGLRDVFLAQKADAPVRP